MTTNGPQCAINTARHDALRACCYRTRMLAFVLCICPLKEQNHPALDSYLKGPFLPADFSGNTTVSLGPPWLGTIAVVAVVPRHVQTPV